MTHQGHKSINLGDEYENLDQKAYQIIKDMIEDRILLPGHKIPQEKLAKELGISRTPLISALKFLEHEKLVEVKPRRGFFVRLFTKKEMISIFEIREVLEGLTARRSAQAITDEECRTLQQIFAPFREMADITDIVAYSRADRTFHTMITKMASREFLSNMLQTFNIISLAYQNVTTEGLIRHPNDTIQDHEQITQAICDRDPEGAEHQMKLHFKKTIDILEQEIDDIK
ncbi:MAG: GntR family transcriptional regulator [Desulfotignum sp.]|nr:GntR family transcriptional regulator [Desulfotignum sp.]MCF8089051.1 GntR family transcriptional regulator [Desulfotignum sp.]MCF8138315.1 GntR family transcriptional regulator [Desulfotignum sp.]